MNNSVDFMGEKNPYRLKIIFLEDQQYQVVVLN